MTSEPAWPGRAVFGTFRGLEAVGDGVLAPIGRHTELLEFRGAKHETVDLPRDGETITFRRVMHSHQGTEYALVGCVRRLLDLTQRPGFYGTCIALDVDGNNPYSTAIEVCLDVLHRFDEGGPNNVRRLGEISGIGENGSSVGRTRNAALFASVAQNKAFDMEAGPDGLADNPYGLGFILEALTMEETQERSAIYIYQFSRSSTHALNWATLNDLLFDKKMHLKNLKQSYRDEAQTILDEEYEKLRIRFEQEKRELIEENEALRRQHHQKSRWMEAQNAGLQTQDNLVHTCGKNIVRGRVTRRGKSYIVEDDTHSVNWRNVLRISGIVIAVILGLFSICIVFYLLYDIFLA